MGRFSGILFFDGAPPAERVGCAWITPTVLALRWVGKVDASLMRLGLSKMQTAAATPSRTMAALLCDTSEVRGFSNIAVEARQILSFLKKSAARTVVVMPHGGVRAFTFAVAMGIGLRVEPYATLPLEL